MGARKTLGLKELVAGVIIITILDQATKILVRKYIELYASIPVIAGFFDLTHLQNRGSAFSFMAQSSGQWVRWGFSILAVLAISFISYVYFHLKENENFLKSGLIMMLGGAVGNLIDRVALGSVTDFIDMYINGHHWPAYNVADSCISIGAVIMGIDWFFSAFPPKREVK